MKYDDFEAYIRNNIAPVQPSAEYDQRIRETLANLPSRKRSSGKYRMMALAVYAAALAVLSVCLLPGSQVLLSTQWLRAYSSDDEQQYIIEGKAFEPEFVPDADADSDEHLVTDSYEEFTKFFACDLNIPQSILPGWQVYQYICARMFDGDGFTVWYSNSDYLDRAMIYSMKWVMTTEDWSHYYKVLVEDGQGWFEEIEGIQVYAETLTEDEGYYFCWVMGKCRFSLQGPVAQEEMMAAAALMIQSFEALPEETKNQWVPESVDAPILVIQTESRQEAMDFLGTDFAIPEIKLDGYHVYKYSCIISRDSSREVNLFLKHDSDPQRAIQVEIIDFWNFKEAYRCYEQSEEGKTIRYGDLDIYISHNYDWLLTICLKGRKMYSVTGTIDLGTAKEIYDMLIPQAGGASGIAGIALGATM